jgi:hypothetical protein
MKRAQLTAAKHADRLSRIAHLLRTTCCYCHAPAGEPCRSKSGTPIWEIGQMHDARLTAPRRQPPLPPIRRARLAMTDPKDPDEAFAAH